MPGRAWTQPGLAGDATRSSGASRRRPAASTVTALLDDQELDSRASTGAIYWEGLSRPARRAAAASVGRGYLEMTGYATRLVL